MQYLSGWLLVLFVILAMGLAGNMELHDRQVVGQLDVMVAEK